MEYKLKKSCSFSTSQTGEGHLPASGSVLRAERPADAHVQVAAAAAEKLLQAAAGGHVLAPGLGAK